ncbi:zeta toxin family protein [Persephonella sp.]
MDKVLFVVAGANGSGKTTFAEEFAKINGLPFLNTDKIARECRSDIEAGRKFLNSVRDMVKNGRSFIIETTLSGRYIKKVVQEAKSNGYQVELIYIFLSDVRANILRVKQRVLKGGHDVKEKDIIRRYYRSKKMFFELQEIFDSWSIIYNGKEKFELVADNNRVYQEDLLRQFAEDITDGEKNAG